MGVVLIVNENDIIVIEELNFGDNDIFLVLVVSLVEVDWLFILIDVDRLYLVDFRNNLDVLFISLVEYIE